MEMDGLFATLADPTRLGAVRLLSRGPMRAGELADALGQSPASMSRHLRLLRRNGVIAPQGLDDDARVRLYSLRPQPFAEMRAWLTEVEAFWDVQLGAFQEHIAKRKKR